MKLPLLALAAAITLAGCAGSESTSKSAAANSSNNSSNSGDSNGSGSGNGSGNGNGSETPPPATAAKFGIEGPADPVQQALSEQLFAALIEGSAPADAASPLPVKLAGVLTCVDNTVSLRALDLIDALAADGAAGPDTLTAPQDSKTLQATQALVSAAGGLIGSVAGQSGCDLAGAPGLPASGGLPSDFPLTLDALTQQAEAIRAVSAQLRNAAAQAGAAPLVPQALALVADAVDDAVTVLQQGTDTAGYQTAVTHLVGNLAANLQALPASLTTGSLPSGTPGLPTGTPGAGASPLQPLTDLIATIPGLNQLPLSSLPSDVPGLPSAPALPGADALSPAGLKAALSAIPGLGTLLAMLPI